MSGAFPICHMGCALRIWLVVSGDVARHPLVIQTDRDCVPGKSPRTDNR